MIRKKKSGRRKYCELMFQGTPTAMSNEKFQINTLGNQSPWSPFFLLPFQVTLVKHMAPAHNPCTQLP